MAAQGSTPDPGELLQEACDLVIHNPALAPERDKKGKVTKTHCNGAARYIAQTLGCHEFDNESLLADDLIVIMQTNESGRWQKVNGSSATIHALGGGLSFAAMSSQRLKESHGHIAAVYPVGQQFSGSLQHDVPMVANVGMCQGEEKSSQAFPVTSGEADYYKWS